MWKAFLVLLGAIPLIASEIPIQKKDLPPAVAKTVDEQTKGAEIRGLSKEVENGKTYYEAETRAGGRSRDILIDEQGTVVEVEDSIRLAEVPAAARAALEKHGTIVSVERSSRGAQVTYEAVVRRNEKKAEVAVNGDGSPAKE